jgi:hypothetical protein
MKLSTLITQANRTYALGLEARDLVEVYRKLKAAGYRDTVRAATTVVDAVLDTADGVRRDPGRVYARMKREVQAAHDGCPRCQQSLRVVGLVGDRQAQYCQACAIALPIKV